MSEEEQRINSRKFHRACHEMRIPIWLAAICFCLASMAFVPSFFKSGGEYILVGIFTLLGSFVGVCWALWSSAFKV